ncbi:MAG: tetratricopeptide repeat protein [Deltaproteobacteria bacterium]|nr:tetratricopeptide repeat protein [Deltaproteobacteria bacterium]
MTSRVLLSFLLWLGVLIVGCVEDEAEREQSAKVLTERYETALARRDLPRALEAVESLESVLPESPESSIVLARMLSRTGHLSEALWLLEAARQRYPDAPNIVLGIAETALLVSDAARALAAADEIGKDDPRHAYAQLLRSRAQLALGDLPAALLTLEQARLAHPENVELTKALIQALLAEGRSEEALSVVRDAQARGRGSEAFVRSIDLTEALILVGMNQVEAGVDALERIIAQDPTNVPAWQSLVKLMIARGETDEALRRVEVAVAVHPSTAEFYALLANLHASLGDPSSAEAAQRQLVDRVEGTAARISVANQLHAAGQTDMAIEVLDAARTQVSISDAANVAYLRVAFLLDDGRMQKARSRFEEFEQAFSGDIRGEYLRARFEFAEGDAQAAAARLRLVVAELDRADVQHWLGLALEAQGDLHGAEYRFGLAIERDRSQVASYLGLIRVFERRGAWREMGAAAAKLISIEPTHPYGYDALAQARFSLGQYAEAEEVLRSYATSFPSLVEPVVGLSSALRHQGNLEEALRVLDESDGPACGCPRIGAARHRGRCDRSRAPSHLDLSAHRPGRTRSCGSGRRTIVGPPSRRSDTLPDARRSRFDGRRLDPGAERLPAISGDSPR